MYKESTSFEQADKIIMEGMGKHFDAIQKRGTLLCRQRAFFISEKQREELLKAKRSRRVSHGRNRGRTKKQYNNKAVRKKFGDQIYLSFLPAIV